VTAPPLTPAALVADLRTLGRSVGVFADAANVPLGWCELDWSHGRAVALVCDRWRQQGLCAGCARSAVGGAAVGDEVEVYVGADDVLDGALSRPEAPREPPAGTGTPETAPDTPSSHTAGSTAASEAGAT